MNRQHFRQDMLARRTFLKRITSTTAGAYGFWLGMSGGGPGVLAAPDFRLTAPEPNAKRGGVLRYGILSAPAHFDLHQSGTVANLGTQGCMYDNLVRRDPRYSGQTIIPDLAHSWEIAKDGKTYTFFLRKGVKFHDGGTFTAEDVKATFQRIIFPPRGFSSPRTPLFSTVSEINVRDSHTIEFKLREGRPSSFMLGAFASGWNVIVRKKTLEDNNYNLRQVIDYPGTGPFRHKRRVDKEVWVMERNPDYWNEGIPYLDGIEFYHFNPFSPELSAALLAGKLDYARTLDPVSLKKVQKTPGMASASFYQSTIHGVWVNNAKKPLSEPHVRRAMHLVLNRPTLVDVVKEVSPVMIGGFLYPVSGFATPPTKLAERPGYQPDSSASIKEARQLLAVAGHTQGLKSLDFMVRDLPHHKLWAVTLQAMLKEALNTETNLRTVQTSVWFDEVQAGNYDLTISAIVSTLIDPSDYLISWYSKDGPQNYSKWHNREFEELLPQINREHDQTKRQALVLRAEALMEQDPPLLPVAWEQVNDGWYTYVKGHNPNFSAQDPELARLVALLDTGGNPSSYFGLYDLVRFDTFWLDK
jgi:ABC-type transport system substrate-binding protein